MEEGGQMKKDKRTINDLQNITHKTKVTRTQLKTHLATFFHLRIMMTTLVSSISSYERSNYVYFTFKFLCKFYSTQVHVYLKLGKNWLMFKESHIRIFNKPYTPRWPNEKGQKDNQ
jgi:hypothetical protein